MHVIAAKAVAFAEALQPSFKLYQQSVLDNAQHMAKTLLARGVRVIAGRTESHLVMLDLRQQGITGKAADLALGQADITVNKNAIPNDPESPLVTSGIRIGTPAITTRGFGIAEAHTVAHWIADILLKPHDTKLINNIKNQVHELTARFPVYR